MGKKLVLFILVVALVTGFAACTSQEGDSKESETVVTTTTAKDTTPEVTTTKEETTTAPVTTKEENPLAEKITINWLVGVNSAHLYQEGRWDELEIEEKFNVDMKLWNIQFSSSNMEQVHMMLAAGDVPDFGFYYIKGQYLMEQGLGRTVPLDMIKKYFPSYYNLLLEDPLGFNFNLVEGTKDEYYGLTGLTSNYIRSGHSAMWRLDWLENLGYEMEDLVPMDSVANDAWDNVLYFTTTKFTIDEVKSIFTSFTEDDPDGNGEDDTYASCFANTWYDMYHSYLLFGFDKDTNHFYKDDLTGNFVPYYAYAPYKDYLSFLGEMLTQGYFRPLPGIDKVGNELLATWGTGKLGFMTASSANVVLGYHASAETYPPASILKIDPDAKFVVGPISGERGKYRPYNPFKWMDAYTQPFGVNVTDEKMQRILTIMENTWFGDDWLRYKWGIEGVHYKWSAEPFNSPIIFTDNKLIPPKYSGVIGCPFGQFGNTLMDQDLKTSMSYDAYSIQFYDYFQKYLEGGHNSDNFWLRPDKFYSPSTMPKDKYDAFTEIRKNTIDEITKVNSEFEKRVREGQIANIDNEWEVYIDQLYAAGLDKWVKIWNDDSVKTYAQYLKGE